MNHELIKKAREYLAAVQAQRLSWEQIEKEQTENLIAEIERVEKMNTKLRAENGELRNEYVKQWELLKQNLLTPDESNEANVRWLWNDRECLIRRNAELQANNEQWGKDFVEFRARLEERDDEISKLKTKITLLKIQLQNC